LAFTDFFCTFIIEANPKAGGGDRPIKVIRKGEKIMRGWRTKLVFLLIVYFGGYATAIYTLAPAPENGAKVSASASTSFFRSIKANAEQDGSFFSAVKSEGFKQSLNSGIQKCLEFSKDAACRTARFIKEKIDERQARTDS
jgi:hypothetical protein